MNVYCPKSLGFVVVSQERHAKGTSLGPHGSGQRVFIFFRSESRRAMVGVGGSMRA